VFTRLRRARLRLNPTKCRFCVPELKYLGHIVNRQGIHTDPEKIKAIEQWPTPSTVRQIRQFVGLASWYRRFIPDFSAAAAPLTSLTKKNARWRWGTEEKQAFRTLKKALSPALILACPDFDRQFIVQTDATRPPPDRPPHDRTGRRAHSGRGAGHRVRQPDAKRRRKELQRDRARVSSGRVGDSPLSRLPGGLSILRYHGPSGGCGGSNLPPAV